MKYLKKYKLFEVDLIDSPFNINMNPFINKMNDEEYEKILGRKGELSKYLRKNGKVFTFGVLKKIFKDAITYKQKREFIKGGYKMIHRSVPMLLAYMYFPVWILGNILGFSRALNKILKPLLKNPETSYNKFLIKFIKSIISISEGEIKYVMGHDWFYDAFVMEDGILKMLKKEVIRNFAIELANKMEKEDDDNEVPHHYIENMLKIYLNNNYNITPKIPLKK
jgi:hypothetical protein